MPRATAFSFIFFTKASSEPAIFSAIATAASFALAIEIHLIIVSTVCVSFGSKKTWEPPILAAYSLTETGVSNVSLPLSSASKIKVSVMIFVILAGTSSLSLSFS